MTLAVITHPACLDHDPGPEHPESAERLRTVVAAVEAAGVTYQPRPAPRVTAAQLALAHAESYVDAATRLRPAAGERVRVDADTVLSEGTPEAALRAAGAAVAGVDLVLRGEARRVFAAVRPPGHHAGVANAMGYCLFNNVAVAARHATAAWRLPRVAIADFDAHHGNGTAAILAHDGATFYASSHQYPCFPGTGRARVSTPRGADAPLPPNAGSAHFRAAWRDWLLPALDEFAPDLLLVSAGFDGHAADPTAHLQLDADDFGWVTAELVRLADEHAAGRVVSVLEGGYSRAGLAASVAAHVTALAAT